MTVVKKNIFLGWQLKCDGVYGFPLPSLQNVLFGNSIGSLVYEQPRTTVQGLLNDYYSTWATQDIHKHLPFVYNMVASATYSYLPAYKR